MHKVNPIHNFLRIPEDDRIYLYHRIGGTVAEVTEEGIDELLEEEVKREINSSIIPPFAISYTMKKVVNNTKLRTYLSRNGLELVSKWSEYFGAWVNILRRV